MEALGKIKTLKEYGNPFLAGGTFGEVCIAIQSEEIAKNDEIGNGEEETINWRKQKKSRYVAIKTIRKSTNRGLTTSSADWGFSPNPNPNPLLNEEIPQEISSEINALRALSDHPNITPLLGVQSDDPFSVSLVFPYCPSDLSTVISHRRNNCKPIPDEWIRCILGDILSGVSHAHSRQILHRDIKPSNFLLSREGAIQLADFGLATAMAPAKSPLHALCTLNYRPPEALFGSEDFATSAGDVWGCGLVMAELLTLRPLFPGRNVLDQISQVLRVLGTPVVPPPWEDYDKVQFQPMEAVLWSVAVPRARDPLLRDLLDSVLKFLPEERALASDCLKHSWFRGSVDEGRVMRRELLRPIRSACEPEFVYDNEREIQRALAVARERRNGGVPKEDLKQVQATDIFNRVRQRHRDRKTSCV